MVLRSAFTYKILIPLFIAVISASLILYLTFMSWADSSPELMIVAMIFLLLFLWSFIGECRRKCIRVTLFEDRIEYSSYFGLGKTYSHKYSDLQGYCTCDLPSNYGEYEYLYILKDDRKRIVISEFYHKNYFELKSELGLRLKDKGKIPFQLRTEMAEVFSSMKD